MVGKSRGPSEPIPQVSIKINYAEMPSEQFKTDNQRGLEGQNYVRDLLRSWYQDVEEAPDSFFPDWDLKVNARTIEVKTDYKTNSTGNICLEIAALDHSQADILAYVTENPRAVYFAPLPQVREFAHQWPTKIRGGEFAGELCLVPRSIFIDRLKPQIINEQPQ
jgi:hypothetical protein